ncbi:MAG: sugar phosphate isomerase/epimerase [Defluviitaleaceae bacterium]|nr:sugar phosphate isomerase/epimerase [Defluviitaleaceae bacterium]
MMTIPFVALQLYTVRDFAGQNVEETLRNVKTMGYENAELAGMYEYKPAELQKLLGRIGLRAISAHVQYAELQADAKRTIAEYKSLGCEYIIIPMLAAEMLPGGANYNLDFFKKFCELCNDEGIIPAYHNHDFEFEQLECGTFKLDKLFNDVPELFAQLDTGWITAAGQNPETYLAKYAGRCPIVHLKDTVFINGGYEDRPVGKGSQNMLGIVKTAKASGAKGFVVELDKAVGLTSLDAASESREYLKSIGC